MSDLASLHSSAQRKATISLGVDVDSLWHYYRIHGLDEMRASDHAWSHGVPRFMELFDSLGAPATFYCVAEDIERSEACPSILSNLVAGGFEIGNHSWRHPYALTVLPAEESTREIERGKLLLEEATQTPVIGFRAPGYHTSSSLHHALYHSGHCYETSAFPCAPYYVAKALVMGGMRLVGRRSQSILGSPRLLTAPHAPYFAGAQSPYRAVQSIESGGELALNDEPLLAHFPIAVWWGLPLIGTLFALLGPKRSQALGRFVGRSLARRPRHLTLEFHAADLLAIDEDELDPALRVQPDLRRSLALKRAAFSGFITALLEESEAEVQRLDQHALTQRIFTQRVTQRVTQ